MTEVVENNLPKGWRVGTVGETGEYINGLAFKPADWHEEGMPIIRIQNLTNPDKPFNLTTKEVDDLYIVNPGDILVSWSATLDAFVWDRKPAILNQHIFKVVPNADVVNGRFLFYTLKRAISEMIQSEHLHGSTMKHINRKPFLAHSVPIPPMEQQKRIVAKIEELFSHIDAGIAALKKAKQLLKQYRQSVLKAAVTGELTKEWRQENGILFDESWHSLELGKVVEIIDPNPSHRYPPYDDGDVPLMATKQMVGEDDWDQSTAKLTTSVFYEQRKASHGFKDDDIIFARKGRLGFARRPPKLSRYAFSHTIFIMRGNEDILSDYLLWFLRREEAISWLLREMNVAAGVPTLGKAILGKLPLLLPSLEEQKIVTEKIEEKLTAIRRMTANIDHQMMKAEKSKQSILATAFSGKLFVKGIAQQEKKLTI